ncbi:DUF4376 domain-containing protein [Campylobacter sp. CCS1377]|uniref:DUF4376 domain-containing protein n=1 Tax=Campylobacter sp. CCS1377 TaxID=3158229 RepID=A0AAU7E4L3_9BACT
MFYDIKNQTLKYDDIFLKDVKITTEVGEIDAQDTYFLSNCDDELLKTLGFAKVVQNEFKDEVDEYHEVVQKNSFDEASNTYTINYVLQEKSLDECKNIKYKEIDTKRDEVIEGGVTYKDKVFQSAEKDRNLLTSTVSLFSITKSLPEGFVWIAKDNTAVPMNLQDLIALGALMASSVNENTIKARNLKDAVLKATTLDEVKGIVWN